MNKAIITLTKGGTKLGLKLLDKYDDSILYVNKKFHIDGDRIYKIENGIKELIPEIFNKYRCLIFIMATGIVVRVIAPYIKDKTIDPAVIVLDEKGKNVISLLSGHLGYANEYTIDIAKKINANPVITTASDVNKTLAVDTIAMKLDCVIENIKDAVSITSDIVNGENVGIISQININFDLPHNIKIINKKEDIHLFKGIIYITNKNITLSKKIDTVIVRPKNLIVGVGCRKGKSKEEIVSAIKDSLNKVNRSILSIKKIVTIDAKKDEKGIYEAAEYFKAPLVVINREQVKKIESQFETSDFVKKNIGVGAVAEPVVILASHNGKLILNKTKFEGITIAIAEEGGY